MAVHRIEVRPTTDAGDPRGDAARRQAESAGLSQLPSRIDTTSVYLVEGDLDEAAVRRLADEVLADPVTEQATIGAAPAAADALIEVHPLPGVMDPDAQAVELAVERLLGTAVQVVTGRRYDLHGVDADAARKLVDRCLANTVIHGIHGSPWHPEAFESGHAHDMEGADVLLSDLDDAGLERLSRDAHLFLDLPEMQAIQEHYLGQGRDPRAIELETLAQTWSEHCVHKTLKATIRYSGPVPDGESPGWERHDDGSVTVHNLLKSTIAQATRDLMDDGIDWCLSVFVDNAGIIAFDDEHAVCFKCETHNHPSAIEPYGGAATGIGGCIRDIMGTGLSARPVAATDVFCVGNLDMKDVPAGCLQPRRVLGEVVRGIRDYGNRMGIPTLNGSIWFDDDYVGNPLVFCGCVGVMPRDAVSGDPQSGDRIIAVGGRTGRDGIHGATFSSAELTDTHADEFAHAVQIGNPVTEKMALDAILEARDAEEGCLFSAITDCGAGGFSSAVGEMGEHLGAVVQLDQAPLKYEGLTPEEIWISEAQERMVLAVPPGNVEAVAAICDRHGAEWCDLGVFGSDDCQLVLRYGDHEVGRLDMDFLHGGLPSATREATWTPPPTAGAGTTEVDLESQLLRLLASGNIASKGCVIHQYDHEVQGRSVLRPLVGPLGSAPGDAAVITPVRGSSRGLAIGSGLATGLAADPRLMAICAIDECVRNLVCVGADPQRIAILDNFCWSGVQDAKSLGALVRCAEGCHDGAMAYRTPFISGKDSLNNQFTTDDGRTIRIPPTLLISGFGIVPDIATCVTMDAKEAGNQLVLVGLTRGVLGGSQVLGMVPDAAGSHVLPDDPCEVGPQRASGVHRAITEGLLRSAHDCSEGGLLVAAAEMAFGGDLGLELDPEAVAGHGDLVACCFSEEPARYLLEVPEDAMDQLTGVLGDLPWTVVGRFVQPRRLCVGDVVWSIDDLRSAWLGGLEI